MSDSTAPLTSYPFAGTGPSTSVETIGPEIIEVVIPFNSGTVAEAVSAAKEIVSNLTPDDIAGLVPELLGKATREDLKDAVRDINANFIVTALIFSGS